MIMSQKNFEVVDEFGVVLAACMTLEVTLMFIEAYVQKYHQENIILKIREMPLRFEVERENSNV